MSCATTAEAFPSPGGDEVLLVSTHAVRSELARAETEGLLPIEVPYLGPEMRGRLALAIESAIDEALQERSSRAPGVAAASDLDGSLSDQLYRARLLGATGLAIALGPLEGLANLAGTLDAEDSAVLRWWMSETAERPIRLLVQESDRYLGVYGPPVPLQALVRTARASRSGGDLEPQVRLPALLTAADALTQADPEAPDTPDESHAAREEHHDPRRLADVMPSVLDWTVPNEGGLVHSKFGNLLPGTPELADEGQLCLPLDLATTDEPTVELAQVLPRRDFDETPREGPSKGAVEGPSEPPREASGQTLLSNADGVVQDAAVPSTEAGAEEPAPEEDPASARIEARAGSAEVAPTAHLAALEAEPPPSVAASTSESVSLDSLLTEPELAATLATQSGLRLEPARIERLQPDGVGLDALLTEPDSGRTPTAVPCQISAGVPDLPDPAPSGVLPPPASVREAVSTPEASSRPEVASTADTTPPANSAAEHPLTSAETRAVLHSCSPLEPALPTGPTLKGALLYPEAKEKWRAWMMELENARGPKPLGVIERMFVSSYVPLSEAKTAGLTGTEADPALARWAMSFDKSYTDSFDMLSLRQRRPTMVLDVPDLGMRLARLHGARSVQLLLVAGMRFDLGLRVYEYLKSLLGQRAALAERWLLWSGLPTTTAMQLELIARGTEAMHRSHAPPECDLMVARGRAAATPRRIKVGFRELFKLDLIEATLSEPGGPLLERLELLARETAEAVTQHFLRLPQRTLVMLFGDHGFLLDPAPGGTSRARQGGASPEEVLVPAYAWLVGDVH
jgi:hypothetical protein